MDKGVDGRKHPVLRKPLISHSISPAFFGVASSCEVVSKQEGGHQEVFSIPSFFCSRSLSSNVAWSKAGSKLLSLIARPLRSALTGFSDRLTIP